MRFPSGSTTMTDLEAATTRTYDAVVVGAGVAGAIIADRLSAEGKNVLLVDAGPGEDISLKGYAGYLDRFYGQAVKDNQAPYPRNRNAPMPRSVDIGTAAPGRPETSGYLVQPGPYLTDTTYTRVLGGTTMHWEAKTPRLLPEDFEMRTRFGQGSDWPIGYDELEPYYRDAERELGVSADVAGQRALGVPFPDDYVFPMHDIPLSYLDKVVDAGIDGSTVDLGGDRYPMKVRPYPQARNGVPNPAYDGGAGYRPVGAVSTHQVEEGQRCQGNNNCVPICPVQAKYHAGKTLAKALQSGRVELLTQAVASNVRVDNATGRVDGIEIRAYYDADDGEHQVGVVKGRTFVLASGAIETARLLLASDLPSTSGLVGRNLMDHAYLLSWALLPEAAGTMRGTVCTGGIGDLRGGRFRSQQAAFSVDIHNDGWGWATGAPYTDLSTLVDEHNLFGDQLRNDLARRISSQLLLAFMVEVLPTETNRVTVDPAYKDQLGNMRPVVSMSIPEYSMRGVASAREVSKLIFQRLGAKDFTDYDPADPGFVQFEGEGYVIKGGNHLAGTHIMGTTKHNSVVNADQRSWDHDNLYLVGGGSMPSIGSANVTLTLAALCYRTAKSMLAELN